jgi:hypothetical protein
MLAGWAQQVSRAHRCIEVVTGRASSVDLSSRLGGILSAAIVLITVVSHGEENCEQTRDVKVFRGPAA